MRELHAYRRPRTRGYKVTHGDHTYGYLPSAATDGHVAIDGDQQHGPDGHSLSDRRDRPHVPLGVRKVRPQGARKPVSEIVGRVEGLDEETGDQVECVDPGECAQQPVGGV